VCEIVKIEVEGMKNSFQAFKRKRFFRKNAFDTGFAQFEPLGEIAVSNVPGFKVGFQGIQ
jgi:NurA-like 5'-3' nuclease